MKRFILSLDPEKVKADAQTVKEKAAGLAGPSTEGANEPGEEAKDSK